MTVDTIEMEITVVDKETEDETIHIVCMKAPDVAFCGAYVGNESWRPDSNSEDDCLDCVEIDTDTDICPRCGEPCGEDYYE